LDIRLDFLIFMSMKPLFFTALFVLIIYNIAPATSADLSKIPNGNYIYTAQKTLCQVCHEFAAPTTGQATLNGFGTDYKNCGKSWGSCLASKDSDGDTYTNEFELNCYNYNWAPFSGPCGSDLSNVFNPGDPLVTPKIRTEKRPALLPPVPVLTAVPNPFGPRTSLRFSLPAGASSASLSIMDAQGKIVKSILLTQADVSRGSADWDGTSVGGTAIAGIYFARLAFTGKVLSARLILAR
jgi:hypothetical protein